MLSEIPSGLRFTEVQIDCALGRLPSAVRFAKACGKTLVKVSHVVHSYSESYHFSPVALVRKIPMLMPLPDADDPRASWPSYGFSNFPNLQEVSLSSTVGWVAGIRQGLPWIYLALSTLRPAPSPCLSTV